MALRRRRSRSAIAPSTVVYRRVADDGNVIGEIDGAGVDRDRPEPEPQRPLRQAGEGGDDFLGLGNQGGEIARPVEHGDRRDVGVAEIVEDRVGKAERPHQISPS